MRISESLKNVKLGQGYLSLKCTVIFVAALVLSVFAHTNDFTFTAKLLFTLSALSALIGIANVIIGILKDDLN